MKARPRRAENRVAHELNVWFASKGLSPVERIPVIGRTGPDLTWNELKLIVDGKSRLKVPKLYRIPDARVYQFGDLVGARLCDLDLLFNMEPVPLWASSTVMGWWEHMAEWKEVPDGIPALIVHWPGSLYKHAVLLIHKKDIEVLHDRLSIARPEALGAG